MSVLSAQDIRALCSGINEVHPDLRAGHMPLLVPFVERTVDLRTGTSYGLGPCTYDLRLKKLDRGYGDPENTHWFLPPGGFALGSTVEHFSMPHDVCGVVMDKSSLARTGLALFNTHIDPGWRGYLTLEFSNRSPRGIALYPGMPIAQVKFEQLTRATQQPYSGKYQDQEDRPVAMIAESPAEVRLEQYDPRRDEAWRRDDE